VTFEPSRPARTAILGVDLADSPRTVLADPGGERVGVVSVISTG
jgi:hypothetical protein